MIQSRYLIVHLIGSGGMGEVYLAVDQRLGNAVALKRTFSSADSNLSEAFEREARTLARLRHPVLPKVIDHFSENDEQFLVMEHVSGDDLSKRIETTNKPFPLNWVMFWADQLLDALSYLHSHEPPIIHRDIKPQNLKLTDENHIILLDFGLCKDSGDKPKTEGGASGSIVGYTPHFAPMEQIRGTGTNPRSDIYSLSATLYQLTTNMIPVDALARADALLGGQADPIQSPTELNAEVPSMISEVILKGLEVSQEKRFATAAEMQKALRRAYSQTQKAMSANTVAFSVDNQTDGAIPAFDQADADQPDAGNGADSSSPAATEVLPITPEMLTQSLPLMTEEPFEATVHMDTGELQEVIHKSQDAIHRSEAKTQIFPGDEIQQAIPEEKVQNEAETPVPVAEIADAHAETPKTPEIQPVQNDATTAMPAVTPPKAKKSRAGLVVGLLIGLLLLAGVGGAAGWFAYKKYFATAKTTPTPVSNANAQPSPSPTDTPPANANQSNNASNSNTETNAKPSASPTPVRPAGGEPTPQTDRPSTVKPKQTPGAKPTPKPKTKDDRTVIIQ